MIIPDDKSRRTKPQLTSARAGIFLVLFVAFSALTYRSVRSGPLSNVRERPVLLATATTIAAPFVGAVARRGQECCVRYSSATAVVCALFLSLGLIAQVAPVPFGRGERTFRLVMWTAGWFAWFLGGPISLLHAFS